MRSVSAAFVAALGGGHDVVTRVDAWYGGVLVAEDLAVIDGRVAAEENALIRTSLQVDIAVPVELVPTEETDPLAPYGQELHVSRGVRHAGTGLLELVSLGWFRIQSSKVREQWRYVEGLPEPWVSSGAVVSVEAFDRMSAVVDSDFLAPETPQLKTSAVAEIRRLVRGLTPLGTFTVVDGAIPATTEYTGDRGDAVRSLAGHRNAVAYIDPDGLFVVRTVATTAAVYEVDTGPQGSLVDWTHVLSRDGIFNGYVARGKTSADVPVQSVALETTGPTRWDGPFGRVPTVVETNLPFTVGMATTMAKNGLAKLRTSVDVVVETSCIPNPALECGDYVGLSVPRGRVVGRVVGFDLPITAEGGAMRLKLMLSREDAWELYGSDAV